ncbi:MAG: hypothetical protein HY561_04620 [Gemmatimonadetes bacterium]|nr:hypothetical protein [Gemmatimonadota bacterium]
MKSFRVKLNPAELAELNQRFPPSRGSSDIGKRAVEIVKCHFRRHHPRCRFVDPPRGADLAVVLETDGTKLFEVKGTAGAGIAWQQLKVSSQVSYDLLTGGSACVLRVTDVYGGEPVVYELRCGEDFRLEPEPRWRFTPIRGA